MSRGHSHGWPDERPDWADHLVSSSRLDRCRNSLIAMTFVAALELICIVWLLVGGK